MTKEEISKIIMEENLKQLLLQDLCARFPYGVKVDVNFYSATKELSCDLIRDLLRDEKSLRPYLRTMASMTEEEAEEYNDLVNDLSEYDYPPEQSANRLIDWLNTNHFDYRGLIEKGVALEAPEDMYNIK